MASRTDLTAGAGPLAPAAGTPELPLLYEDDPEEDLGESNPHVLTDVILFVCLQAHLANQPGHQVFSNLNLYYLAAASGERPPPYVSPDVMVVVPDRPLGEATSSYQIGRDGPAPVLVAEILSERSAQQRDLHDKVTLYARLGVAEYVLIDVTGAFLSRRLLLKRLQPDQTWRDEQDPDGGVTSRLGFRLVVDSDGALRVLDAATGSRYPRPREAVVRVRELEAELERLRRVLGERENP
jgi:Uma2 family endonuclease